MVCQGYALLTYRLLGRLDVPCKIIMSDTHSWNIVQMEDGLWYHLDCTNDDLGIYGKQNIYDYFLKPQLTGEQYDYKQSCILYDSLNDYAFGTRRYSRTEVLYILDNFITKLVCVDVEIMASFVFAGSIMPYVAFRRKRRLEKLKKEEQFIQYNQV